jgi:hypothetical protein
VNDTSRIERLISMAERLIAALESDIAVLKAGKAHPLSAADPEVQ